MIEILPGYADNVLAARWSGKVTAEEYQAVLEPAAKAKLKKMDFVRLLAVFDKNFEAMTAGAMWEDSKLGFLHWSHFGRIAVVTDVHWLENSVRLFAPFFHHPVKVFPTRDMAAAKSWIETTEG